MPLRMILSQWFLRSKNSWWARREAVLTQACVAEEVALRQTLQERHEALARQQRDVEHLERTQQERKEALARANEDLRTQLRLLEAKAAPDHVWAEAFSLGFSKAWDMMMPLMAKGVQASEAAIRTQAIEETLSTLAPTHQVLAAGEADLRLKVDLLKKQDEFRLKLQSARGAEGERYQHYLAALEWALGSPNGH